MASSPKQTTEVKTTLRLSPDALRKLKERANGDKLSDFLARYATNLVEADLLRVPLDQILAPVREAFERTGMSDDELGDMLERAKREARAQRRQPS